MIDKPPKDTEPEPGGWERFERAVDAALHTPPKHRSAKGEPESKREQEGKAQAKFEKLKSMTASLPNGARGRSKK